MTRPQKTTAINRMPRTVNFYLCVVAGVLLATYVVLMVTTILFAALQTQLARDMEDKHMAIGKLESSYYRAIGDMDESDPRALGYVTPTLVHYVTAAQPSGLTVAR